MDEKKRNIRWNVLYILGGALAGIGYWLWLGEDAAQYAVTSNPVFCMAFMAFVGWLAEKGTRRNGCGCCGNCRTVEEETGCQQSWNNGNPSPKIGE